MLTTTQRSHQSNAHCGAKEPARASSAEERQSSKHMRGKVSLSSLDWISYRDAPSRWEKNPPRRVLMLTTCHSSAKWRGGCTSAEVYPPVNTQMDACNFRCINPPHNACATS